MRICYLPSIHIVDSGRGRGVGREGNKPYILTGAKCHHEPFLLATWARNCVIWTQPHFDHLFRDSIFLSPDAIFAMIDYILFSCVFQMLYSVHLSIVTVLYVMHQCFAPESSLASIPHRVEFEDMWMSRTNSYLTPCLNASHRPTCSCLSTLNIFKRCPAPSWSSTNAKDNSPFEPPHHPHLSSFLNAPAFISILSTYINCLTRSFQAV